MNQVNSFPPIADANATRLILGSMPGRASLEAGQYYAHPRNAFWSIMGTIFDFPADLPYAQRSARLIRHGVALWDVMYSCHRPGSLDADIVASSIKPNDFKAFLCDHPALNAVYFNGAVAQKVYRRRVLPTLPPEQANLPSFRLPSTSPAHAAFSYQQKLAQWRIIG